MATYPIYHHDSYQREMEATVTAVEDNKVALDQTVFYAQSGGQPFDKGVLTWDGGAAQVVDVRRVGDEIWHQLDGPLPPVGTKVHGAIDWERRYALMRAHSALHVLCGIVWRDLGAPVTGGSMDVGAARMDFELESMTRSFAEDMQERLDAEIAADRPIRVQILPRGEAFAIPDLIRTKINLLPPGITEVRTVEIVGLDLQADGGTHVASTREIGHARITGHESKGKINKRLRLVIE